MQKNITPMELLTLFHKSDDTDVNLTMHEKVFLSVLITFINSDLSKGYRAWPSTELLMQRSGIRDTTLTAARKSLLREGFLLCIEPAKGPGKPMMYWINADKIVQTAAKAGAKASDRSIARALLPVVKEPHKRNVDKLKNAKSVPKQDYSNNMYDDDPEDCPF